VVGLEEEKGRAENGNLYEQPIRIPGNGEDEGESALEVRRIRLLLDEPTRDGDTEIVVLTNLPEEDASAEQVASLYRRRQAFEYNLLSVLKSTLSIVYGRQTAEEEVSGCYIAGEIAKTREGLKTRLPPGRWSAAATMPKAEVVALIRQIARNADLERYQKHPREPKKPLPQRTKNTQTPHVSSAKLLAQRKNAP
jgi:hypothetical protein